MEGAGPQNLCNVYVGKVLYNIKNDHKSLINFITVWNYCILHWIVLRTLCFSSWIFSKVIKRWWGKLRSPDYCSHSFKFLCDVSALKSEKVQLVACGRNHTLICTGQCLVFTAVFFQVLMNIKHACVDVCL